eukprot:9972067-Alexandrium_andersonii.AAC.1
MSRFGVREPLRTGARPTRTSTTMAWAKRDCGKGCPLRICAPGSSTAGSLAKTASRVPMA